MHEAHIIAWSVFFLSYYLVEMEAQMNFFHFQLDHHDLFRFFRHTSVFFVNHSQIISLRSEVLPLGGEERTEYKVNLFNQAIRHCPFKRFGYCWFRFIHWFLLTEILSSLTYTFGFSWKPKMTADDLQNSCSWTQRYWIQNITFTLNSLDQYVIRWVKYFNENVRCDHS